MSEFSKEMYIGENIRDASSKVRGFIYQDLLAIEQLIQSQDESFELYSEWAEDIYSETDKEIIVTQVKYYTSYNKIDFKEVYTELFYQYLRLNLLECNKNIKCKLSYYACNQRVKVGTEVHIKKCIHDISDCNLSNLNKSEKLKLLNSIYIDSENKSRKKSEREDILYKISSNNKLLDQFITFSYVEDLRKEDLATFRESLKYKIYDFINDSAKAARLCDWDKEILSQVCLSVAIVYIQESYNEDNKDEHLRKRTKTELIDRIVNIINYSNELKTITYILNSYVDECLIDYILQDSSLKETENEAIKEIIKFYENLAASTKKFFDMYLSSDERQYALLNTISKKNSQRINKGSYSMKSYLEKSKVFMENKASFDSFLKNVWKVLYNLNCAEFERYIKTSCTEYLEFEFPKQNKIVILPSLGIDSPKLEAQHVFSRYKKLKEKPYKWLWRNNIIRGVRNYNLDVRQISEDLKDNSAYILNDTFEVECMQCIKLQDHIATKEKCEECIFSTECLERRE